MKTIHILKQQIDDILGLCEICAAKLERRNLVGPCTCRFTHQAEAAIVLYRLAHPNHDDIEKFVGHPKVNRNTSEYIFKLFIQFDRCHHQNVINGGCWLNIGFGCNDQLHDFEIEPAEFTLKPGIRDATAGTAIVHANADVRGAVKQPELVNA